MLFMTDLRFSWQTYIHSCPANIIEWQIIVCILRKISLLGTILVWRNVRNFCKRLECGNGLIHERFVLSEIISSILLWHTLPRIQFLSFSYFDHLLMPNVSHDRYILIGFYNFLHDFMLLGFSVVLTFLGSMFCMVVCLIMMTLWCLGHLD